MRGFRTRSTSNIRFYSTEHLTTTVRASAFELPDIVPASPVLVGRYLTTVWALRRSMLGVVHRRPTVRGDRGVIRLALVTEVFTTRIVAVGAQGNRPIVEAATAPALVKIVNADSVTHRTGHLSRLRNNSNNEASRHTAPSGPLYHSDRRVGNEQCHRYSSPSLPVSETPGVSPSVAEIISVLFLVVVARISNSAPTAISRSAPVAATFPYIPPNINPIGTNNIPKTPPARTSMKGRSVSSVIRVTVHHFTSEQRVKCRCPLRIDLFGVFVPDVSL